MEILKARANEIAEVVKKVEGATDVQIEKVSGLAYLQVEIDRSAIARYGINVADINEVLELASGGKAVSELFEGQKRFGVALRFPATLSDNPEKFGELLISAPDGARIPLKQLARIKTEEGPAQISRENGSRRIVVECNVSGRDIGSFVASAQKALEAKVKLPAGYYLDWGGQFETSSGPWRVWP